MRLKVFQYAGETTKRLIAVDKESEILLRHLIKANTIVDNEDTRTILSVLADLHNDILQIEPYET